MQKKDDKVGNEDANKEERQSKKGEQEKEMEIDSKKKTTKKMSKFWLLRMREKQKSLLNYARLVGKYVFFLEKLIFSHSYANESKTSPKKRRWWKMRFFRCCPAVTKGLKKVTNLFQIDLFPHKKVKFAKFSTKQVYNVTMKQLQCLLLNYLSKWKVSLILRSVQFTPFCVSDAENFTILWNSWRLLIRYLQLTLYLARTCG